MSEATLGLVAAALFAANPLVMAGNEADFVRVWSVGDTRWFGADLEFGATDWMKTGNPTVYSIATRGRAKGYLLGYSKTLGNAETKFDIPSVGVTTTSSGYLNVFDTYIAKWSEPLQGNASFRTQPFFSKQEGGSAKLSIGPVGVKLSVSAEVSSHAAGTQAIEYSTKRAPVKKIKAGPVLDGAVSGTVSADVYVLGAGLDANLKLTGYALNSEVVVLPRAANQAPQASWKITADTTATDGKLEGWLRVGIKRLLSKTFRKTFAEYAGGPSSTLLTQGTR